MASHRKTSSFSHLAIVATAINRLGVSVPVAGWWTLRCAWRAGWDAAVMINDREKARKKLKSHAGLAFFLSKAKRKKNGFSSLSL